MIGFTLPGLAVHLIDSRFRSGDYRTEQPGARKLALRWMEISLAVYSERLEQLDWVAGWILYEDLFASISGHNGIAEVGALTF